MEKDIVIIDNDIDGHVGKEVKDILRCPWWQWIWCDT